MINESQQIKLACGAHASLDSESTCYAYVCNDCLCVVGSMSMPARCVELTHQRDVWVKSGGKL